MNTALANTRTNQPSQLLPALFPEAADAPRMNVLHLGPAFQDTVDFFSGFRCRLRIFDLFAELPLPAEEDTERGLRDWLHRQLQFQPGETFDICLFWDLFNYLDGAALGALMTVLEPHLTPHSRAHGFSVHNPKEPQGGYLYGIGEGATLNIRERTRPLPGYAPHSQHRLRELLGCFDLERSVLLPDRRLELLLCRRAAAGNTATPM